MFTETQVDRRASFTFINSGPQDIGGGGSGTPSRVYALGTNHLTTAAWSIVTHWESMTDALSNRSCN